MTTKLPAAITEVCTPRACAQQQREAVHQNEEYLLLTASRESLHTAMTTQHSQKKCGRVFFLLEAQTISCMENGMWLRQQSLCCYKV